MTYDKCLLRYYLNEYIYGRWWRNVRLKILIFDTDNHFLTIYRTNFFYERSKMIFLSEKYYSKYLL